MWGIFEDELHYKILFTRYSPLIMYSLWKHGYKTVVMSINTEYLQGWPWIVGLVDKSIISFLLLYVAWGADPFASLALGDSSLLFVWIATVIELCGIILFLHTSVKKKSWRVVGKRGVACCCCKVDIPWPLVISQEEYDLKQSKDAKVDSQELPTEVKSVEMSSSKLTI